MHYASVGLGTTVGVSVGVLVGSTVGLGEAVGVRLGVVDGVGVWVRVAVNVGVKVAGTNGVFVAVKVGLGVWVATGVGGGMEGACVGEAATVGLTVGVRRPGARRMAIRPAQ